MMHVKMKSGLKYKIIRIMLIFSIIQTLIAILVSVRVFSANNLSQNEELAGHIASTTLSMIGTDDLTVLRNQVVGEYQALYRDNQIPQDDADAEQIKTYYQHFDTVTQSDRYKKIRNILTQIKASNNVSELYISYIDTDTKRMIYIADGSRNPETAKYPGDSDLMNDAVLQKYINEHYKNDTYIAHTTDSGWVSSSGETILDSQGNPICCIATDVPMNAFLKEWMHFALEILAIMLILQIPITLFMIRHINKIAVNPINLLNEAVSSLIADKHGNKGASRISQLSLHSGDEIEELSVSLKQMEQDINGYLAEITDITTEKEHMQAELDIAARIQLEALPHRFPPFPDRNEMDIFASMKPAREVGGDFYDFFMIDDDHLAMVIGDVSGKGIPAALFMMVARTVIRNGSEACFSPQRILERANRQLCENNDTHMFVTVWMGILTLSDGDLVYVNAGHEYPAYRCAGEKYELIKEEHDLVLGGRKKTTYTEFHRKMAPGDKLFVYTDGVPEANNPDEKMYGTDRMLQALNQASNLDMSSTLKNIEHDVTGFTEDAPQFDDLTMMGILYKGSTANQK